LLTCASCGTQNEDGRKFCGECGAQLAISCQACGTANPPSVKFCGECGGALAIAGRAPGTAAQPGTAETPPGDAVGEGVPSTAGAERRLVTVLFNDLVGFTTASEGRDAEETRELLGRYFETATQIVERHGGTVEKFIGDAVMAVWGAPTAHEDDAERAVRAALELVAAVGTLEPNHQLQARAGLLTGEAAVTIGAVNQGMVAGDLVNTASRLQSVAEPGTVLVGESTYRAAGSAIAFEPMGEQELKGKAAPVATFRATAVVGRRGGQGRAATLEPPFVGRGEELRLLKDLFHATAREGKARLVTISGQAGIGKSRLGWELEKYLDGVVDEVYWHEGRSPSYGEGISYWALAEIIRARSGVAEGMSPEEARSRLDAMLDEHVPDTGERRWIEPRFAALLGVEPMPTESREQLFAAWRTFFERMAEKMTVILVFRDLQWADQGLLDFIEHLLTWARSSPIFVLAEARPELFERRPGWGSGVRSATSVQLDPLRPGEMAELLTGLVPGLPAQAVEAIVGRAEGVPLYAVETLRMLVDRGVLRPEADHYVLDGDLPTLTVPETLHALIAARLDSLDPDDRSVATTASVLGLSFTLPALQAVTEQPEAELEAALERLIRHQLLLMEADPRSPERGQYKFVQGVIREVAYGTLSRRDRRAMHLGAARFFESLDDEELAGVLASHYLDAHRSSSEGPEADALAAQARVTLRAAADRAASLHSEAGAMGYLEQALEVTSDPQDQAALHERAGRAASLAGLPDKAIGHARSAEERYAAANDRLGVLRARTLQGWTLLEQHQDRAAATLLREALSDAADLPPSAEAATAESELARALMLGGSPEAIEWADRVLGSPELVDDDTLLQVLVTKGTVLIHQERGLEAEVVLRGAIVKADLSGNVNAALRARNNLLSVLNGESMDAAMALIRETHDMARRFGNRTALGQALGVAADTSFELGDWDAWIEEMREEMPDDSTFYGLWRAYEDAALMVFRGEASAALEWFRASATREITRESAQAMAANASSAAEALIALGRYEDAFESARRGWDQQDNVDAGVLAAILAAAGGGRPGSIHEALEALAKAGQEDTRGRRALRQMGETLIAVVEGRWDAGRAGYLAAARELDEYGARTSRARLQLAVGHAAAGRFPEADEAAAAAQEFFAERGAQAYVDAYRQHAFRPEGSSAAESAPSGRLAAEASPDRQ
jgi:class 3 adenylate cyclase/tetratricopeptide (TPR) repeat protein